MDLTHFDFCAEMTVNYLRLCGVVVPPEDVAALREVVKTTPAKKVDVRFLYEDSQGRPHYAHFMMASDPSAQPTCIGTPHFDIYVERHGLDPAHLIEG